MVAGVYRSSPPEDTGVLEHSRGGVQRWHPPKKRRKKREMKNKTKYEVKNKIGTTKHETPQL